MDADNLPVKDAIVTISENNNIISSATTDENGAYTIEGVPNGDYIITATYSDLEIGGVINTPDGLSCENAFESMNLQFSGNKEVILEEDFEDYSIGPFSNGTGDWTIEQEYKASANISDVAGSGNRSLRVDLESEGFLTIGMLCSKSFTTANDVIYFEGYIQSSDTSTTKGFYLIDEGTTTYYITMGCDNGEIIVRYGKESDEQPTEVSTHIHYAKDTWYKIKLKLEVNNNLWMFCVDDVVKARGSYDGIIPSIISFGIISTPYVLGSVYFDGISIYCYTPTK